MSLSHCCLAGRWHSNFECILSLVPHMSKQLRGVYFSSFFLYVSSSSFSIFDAHLWTGNLASSIILFASLLNFLSSSMSLPVFIRLSTYVFLFSDSTVVANSPGCWLKWWCNVPPKHKWTCFYTERDSYEPQMLFPSIYFEQEPERVAVFLF